MYVVGAFHAFHASYLQTWHPFHLDNLTKNFIHLSTPRDHLDSSFEYFSFHARHTYVHLFTSLSIPSPKNMAPAALSTAKTRLRRWQSMRSIRKKRRRSAPQLGYHNLPLSSSTDRFYAITAASYAMHRSNETPPASDSHLGHPSNIVEPHRPCASDRRSKSSSAERDSDPRCTGYSSMLSPIHEVRDFDGMDPVQLNSSYGRFRRSSSMVAPGHGLSHVGMSGRTFRHNSVSNRSHASGFSRASCTGHHASDILRRSKSHDAAIQLARSQFSRASTASDENTIPDSLYPLKSRRQHDPFRRTRTMTSESETNSHIGVPHDEMPPSSSAGRLWSGRLRGRARNFSNNIKSGIKRMLRTSSRAMQTSMSSTDSNDLPGLVVPAVELQGHEDTTSLHSKSRVTSWADSTAADIDPTEPQDDQLPAIQELDSYPERAPSDRIANTTPGAVDSRRLYSALMRHMSEEEDARGREERFVTPQSQPFGSSPNSIAAAIRHARPVNHLAFPDSTRNRSDDWRQGRNSNDDLALFQPGQERDTPSVYSRTTGALDQSQEVSGLDEQLIKSDEEPGTATIYGTQCSPYSLPRSNTRWASLQPSGGWQQWAKDQMANIESPRWGHYRENAQINEEEEDVILSADFTNAGASAMTEKGLNSMRIPELLRSPSIRSIISTPRQSAPPNVTTRPASPSSHSSSYNVATAGAAYFPLGRSGKENDSPPSLSPMRIADGPPTMRMRAQNSIRHASLDQSPTPKREAAKTQTMWASEQQTARHYYPGVRPPAFPQDAKIGQFLSIRRESDNRRANENTKDGNGRGFGDDDDSYANVGNAYFV